MGEILGSNIANILQINIEGYTVAKQNQDNLQAALCGNYRPTLTANTCMTVYDGHFRKE